MISFSRQGRVFFSLKALLFWAWFIATSFSFFPRRWNVICLFWVHYFWRLFLVDWSNETALVWFLSSGIVGSATTDSSCMGRSSPIRLLWLSSEPTSALSFSRLRFVSLQTTIKSELKQDHLLQQDHLLREELRDNSKPFHHSPFSNLSAAFLFDGSSTTCLSFGKFLWAIAPRGVGGSIPCWRDRK